jgi:ribosomal protein L32
VAVPKKRKTRSAQGQHRSHDGLTPVQLVATTGGRLVPRRLKKAAELGLLKVARKA